MNPRLQHELTWLARVAFLTALMIPVCPHCVQAQSAPQTTSLRIAVDSATGNYTIAQGDLTVLKANVAAKVDGRWLHARDYPKHAVAESTVDGDLGNAKQWTITHSGLEGAPELVCVLRAYGKAPYGDIQVRVTNSSAQAIHVQAIRPIEAASRKILDLGGPAASVRVLSDSFSEDRPAMKIHDLADAENRVHRAVGSQLLYNRQNQLSFFAGALTSERFLSIFRIHVAGSGAAAQIEAFEVDSTGTTEATKEESLKDSPAEDQIELSLPVALNASLSSEKLVFGVSTDYHAQLGTYGSLIRTLHHARVSAPTPMGWWSWTAFYMGLNEGTAFTNAHWLAQHLAPLGYNFFHIDEGYQYARGEYTTPDASHFPHGMAALEDNVRSDGLTPGIWTAPFEVSERSWIYEHQRDWLVHNAKGEPIHLGKVADNKDQLYALDPTHPGAQEYLQQTYSTLVKDWNIRYIKLDFMEDSAVEGVHHRADTTALEAQRIGLEVIRKAVGERVLLDKDGSPMLNPVGIVDTGRISLDTGHLFAGIKDTGTGIAARYYMNRNFFVSDPDAFCVSKQVVTDEPWHGGRMPLTLDEAKISIALSAVSGGMYEIGDDLPSLASDPERLALVQNKDLIEMAKLGRASIPLDLMSYAPEDEQPSIFFLKEDARQSILAIFNWTEKPRSHPVSFASLGLPAPHPYRIVDVFDGKEVSNAPGDAFLVKLPPHSVRVLKIINAGVPAKPPVAKAEHPTEAKTGAALEFRAQPAASNEVVVSYRWDFDDGVTEEGTDVWHAYTQAGTYRVTLTAVGLGGLSSQEGFSVKVTGGIRTRFDPAEKRRCKANE